MKTIVPRRTVRRTVSQQVQLRGGVLLRLRGVRGVRLYPTQAALWITYQGEPADHIAEPGQSFEIRHDGVCYATAEDPTAVTLYGEAQTRSGWAVDLVEPIGRRRRIVPTAALMRWAVWLDDSLRAAACRFAAGRTAPTRIVASPVGVRR